MKFEIKCSNFFKSGENMIITNNIVNDYLEEYSNKNTKLLRDVKVGKLFKIVNVYMKLIQILQLIY